MRAIIKYRGKEQFVTYPASGSDGRRGVLNCLPDVKRTLAGLGAERIPERKATGPKRRINKGADLREIASREKAPRIPDPWEVLKAVKFAPPPAPKPSFWARVRAKTQTFIQLLKGE